MMDIFNIFLILWDMVGRNVKIIKSKIEDGGWNSRRVEQPVTASGAAALNFLNKNTANAVFLENSWLRGMDLNQRPSGYEPDELPDCSTPR